MLARLIAPIAVFALLAPAASAAEPGSASRALERAEAALEGRGEGHEVTLRLRELAVAFPRLEGAKRAVARRLLARPTPGQGTGDEEEYRVPEHNPPYCTANFCVHWVDSTSDAPPLADNGGVPGVPDHVEMVGASFEQSYQHQNVVLRWREPVSDGTAGCPPGGLGCADKTDVYLQDVGDRGIYGYAAPDPGQDSFQQAAYLVIDNDFADEAFRAAGYTEPVAPTQVTAAHEYNHVLHFTYDVIQDSWMFEATATWMEDEVFTHVNDYRQYLPIWAAFPFIPLTNPTSGEGPASSKAYAASVWNRWLDAKFGPDVIRDAWERSLRTDPQHFAPGAYDGALEARGSSFDEAFGQFTADTAEWRAANSPFEEGSSFPDVQREELALRPGERGGRGNLDHTGYFLLDVPPTSDERIKLVFEMATGPSSALALVGRVGDPTGGAMTSVVKRLPRGGTGVVVLDNPSQYARITGMVANADPRVRGFSDIIGDWVWMHDGEPFRVRVSTDFTRPRLTRRSPGRGRRGVPRRASVKMRFNERMSRVRSSTAKLRGPGNRRVRARVRVSSNGRRVTIDPRGRLRPGTTYTVKLSRLVRDLGANPLRRSHRTWRFRTGG